MRSFRIPFFTVIAGALFTMAGAFCVARAQVPTTTTLQQTSACLTSGCVTTLTATVTAGSKAVSPGFVYFCNRTDVSCESRVPLGVVPLSANGTATLPIQLATGSHLLRAIFHGTKANAKSESNSLSLTITPGSGAVNRATVTTITATPVPTGYTLSSTVSSMQAAASGSVSFLDASNHNAVVATAPLGGGVPAILYSQSSPDFSQVPSSLFVNAANFFPGDFNHDGYQDLEIQEGDGSNDLLLGNGKGVFTLSTAAPSPNGTYPLYPAYSSIPSNAAAVGDFNNDGVLDYAAFHPSAPYAAQIDIFLGDGTGAYHQTATPLTVGDGYNLSNLLVADFGNRGVMDIAAFDIYGGAIQIFSSNGDGTFTKHLHVVNTVFNGQYTVGDFDGDGIPDIVTNNPSDVTLYHGNGDFTFSKTATQSVVPASGILAGYLTGDFNGDGVLDIAAISATNAQAYGAGMTSPSILQTLFYNAQKTRFDLGASLNAPYGTFLATGDLTSDGLPDFCVYNTLLALGAPYPPPPPTLFGSSNVVSATATTMSPVMLAGPATHNVLASFPGDTLHTASMSATVPLLGSATDFPSGINGQQGIAVNGSATIQGNSIVLTDGKQFEAGSFFSSNRFSVANGFSTDFDFQITNASADGFAFVLQNNGPDAIGASGGGLGYGSAPGTSTGGITNSVAVAFDLHNNQGEGSNSVRVESGGVTNGTSTDLTPSGIDLHSGHHFHVNITSINSYFDITITDLDTKAVFNRTMPTGTQVRLNYYLNGSVAYVGFTGGTGNTTAVQTISNWVFTPAPPVVPLYTSPTYPTGFAGGANLQFNGGATVSGSAIDLTHGTTFEASSVYFTPSLYPGTQLYPEEPEPTFVYTDFDFQVVNGVGDGFTFVLQNQGLKAVGSSGGGLGYGPDRPNGAGASIPNSLALKFDLHNNAGEGTDSTGVYLNGASPTTPSTDLTHSGIDLSSGHVFHVHLELTNTNDQDDREDVNLTITDLTKYKVFSTEYAFYFPVLSFYAGFTAGTGATPSNIKILNWTWTGQ